ncbi:hypothetical protein AAI421_12160 [Rhodococcus aetherivorans]|uniref:hypothetical protein n=1 Tax=Rhodococcus aetherivorans TaxID=191292 RepID=UPI000B0A139C
MSCTHQFLVTLTVQTDTINPTTAADHLLGTDPDDPRPVVVTHRGGQHVAGLSARWVST